ncbi:hypothetical protein AO368_0716 [Moraxella catarrhalis]|nr:hypothetical protein AO378_1491 [Moraxella catarrhalis]OAV23956.1 hypothetical protein AO369_1904 [Moraxella catarrhalis]OAV31224.1 hypothetical protein AO368_0716 [Moraxella catarrhalis]
MAGGGDYMGHYGAFLLLIFVIKYEQKYQNTQKWCIIKHTVLSLY